MTTVALVTALAARDLGEDLPPLADALGKQGVIVNIASWDDSEVDWSIFDAAILHSTCDYTTRLTEFKAWLDHVVKVTKVMNPPELIGWNTDKHYLANLADRGIPTIPTTFVEPDQDADQALARFLDQSRALEFVVKPAVGGGERDTQRYGRSDTNRAAAVMRIRRLLQDNRSVLLQPYLDLTEETALIFFDGQFSHAIRKGAILRSGEGSTEALFAEKQVEARVPDYDELKLGRRAIKAIAATTPIKPLYARVDLIHDANGAPYLSELELTASSLYFNYAQGSAKQFAELICRVLEEAQNATIWENATTSIERLEKQARDRANSQQPTIFISGDATLNHVLLQQDDRDVHDRFLKGQTLDDFYVPGGTFLLEAVQRACAKQGEYVVYGPDQRGWIWPHYKNGLISVRAFSQDTTTVAQVAKHAKDKAHKAYRVREGVGTKPGTYTTQVERWREVLEQRKSPHPKREGDRPKHEDGQPVEPGIDDNYLFVGKDAASKLPKPFVHVLNFEFDHFGRVLNYLDRDDRVAQMANIDQLEKSGQPHWFVLKIQNNGAWNEMRDQKDRDIRQSIVDFLLKKSPTPVSESSLRSERGDRSVIVISADELRQANIYVSNHLSWERTIQSAILELGVIAQRINALLDTHRDKHPEDVIQELSYGFLLLPRYLVISFGCDGALLLELQLTRNPGDQKKKKRPSVELTILKCLFTGDLSGAEGKHVEEFPGRIRGFDSLLTVSIAHQLMASLLRTDTEQNRPDSPMLEGVLQGIRASRYLQSHGFDLHQENKEKILDWWSDLYPQTAAYADLVRRYSVTTPKADSQRLKNLPLLPLDTIGSILCAQERSVEDKRVCALNKKLTHAELDDAPQWREIQLRKMFRVDAEDVDSISFLHCVSIETEVCSEWIKPLDQGYSNEGFKNVREAAAKNGYGSFDLRWWTLIQAGLPRDLVACFNIPLNRVTQNVAEDEACRRNLCIAYAVLIHGLDIFYPKQAADVVKRVSTVLATLVDVCATILAHTKRTQTKHEHLCSIMQELTQYLISDSAPEWTNFKKFYEEGTRQGWKAELCDSATSNVREFQWKGHLEDVRPFLQRICEYYWKNRPRLNTLLARVGAFPRIAFGNLQSIDRREIEAYRTLFSTINEYLRRSAQVKPLNIGVFGPAGAGKSFGVTEIINALPDANERFKFLTFNLSQLRGPDDLADAFEEVQNTGVQNKIPVVFWDEFDTMLKSVPLGWLPYFLGPMNDGKYFRQEQSRELPKCIFVFAGSMFDEFAIMHQLNYGASPKHKEHDHDKLERDQAKSEGGRDKQEHDQDRPEHSRFTYKEWLQAKGPDFKSRLTATLDVFGLNPPQDAPKHLKPRLDPYANYIRRAVVLRAKLQQMQPSLFNNDQELRIHPNIARGFIELQEYFHETRSLEQIIRMCDFGDSKVFDYAALPPASQMVLHAVPTHFDDLVENVALKI